MSAAGAEAKALGAIEDLFSQWRGLRQDGRLPSRRDLDPCGFRKLLPMISIADVAAPQTYRFRLAGTGFWELYGREVTHLTLTEAFDPALARYWGAELDKVVATRRPAVGATRVRLGREAAATQLYWVRLPLSSDGVTVDAILGYDAPIRNPLQGLTGVKAA